MFMIYIHMKDVSVTGFCWLFFIPVENHSFRNVTIAGTCRSLLQTYDWLLWPLRSEGFFILPTSTVTQDLNFKVSSERPVISTTNSRCLAREWSIITYSYVNILDLTQHQNENPCTSWVCNKHPTTIRLPQLRQYHYVVAKFFNMILLLY